MALCAVSNFCLNHISVRALNRSCQLVQTFSHSHTISSTQSFSRAVHYTRTRASNTPSGDAPIQGSADSTHPRSDRNFVTELRAIEEFSLDANDLATLSSTSRRSPFESEPPIKVYSRHDVMRLALARHGTTERANAERRTHSPSHTRAHNHTLFSVKKMLRDYRREQRRTPYTSDIEARSLRRSASVVHAALLVNAGNFVIKALAYAYTGSSSLFSETLHSLADTANQLLLALGLRMSMQRASADHPYGFSNVRHVASLISGVGVFCLGSGASCYHGISRLCTDSASAISLASTADMTLAYMALTMSLVSECVTLYLAVRSISVSAAQTDCSTLEYIRRGADPSVNVVLMEDLAALLGVLIASSCLALTAHTGNVYYDVGGCLCVGGLLAAVASFIIYTNAHVLVGRSIPAEELERINLRLEEDVMIRGVYDVKGIDMGNGLVRYKCEIDFDGRALVRKYIERHVTCLEAAGSQATAGGSSVEGGGSTEILLRHGEAIVDMMGAEIDRIETELKRQFPHIRHIDLEIL